MKGYLGKDLQQKYRTLRTLPGQLLLGPTGARLFADYLEPVSGFMGRIDFIHKLNLPGIFQIQDEENRICEPVDAVWNPSTLHLTKETEEFSFEECKFITWEVCAVSCQRWENRTNRKMKLIFALPQNCWKSTKEQDCILLERSCKSHEINLVGAICSDNGIHLTGMVEIEAGKSAEFVLAAAIGEKSSETMQDVISRVKQYIAQDNHNMQRVQKQQQEYEEWFEDIPVFESDDTLLDKTWKYRWFLLRHNYASPNCGNMKHGVFYEGRSHKTVKDLYAPRGHEFTQLIPLSTPLHLLDCRWKKNSFYCEEAIKSLIDSADEQGLFHTMMVDKMGAVYGNFAGWALYQTYLTYRNKTFLQEILGAFRKNLFGTWQSSKNEADDLPICRDHRRTGKEYQPSFWYFRNYPDNAKDNTSFDWMKRVDLAVYLYLNARGIARLSAITEDEAEAACDDLAERLKQQILSKMWDEETGFFYDLHHETEEKAMVRNVVGIYPLWAQITEDKHLELLKRFFSEDDFAAGSGFASVSRDCPVFAPQGGWKGNFFKGRNGCMWDGPSWPYTTGIALDAIALQSKNNAHRFDKEFGKYLREYSLEHYKEKNLDIPYLVEHYDSVTGEALSDEPDYLHSFYIDLIVRHVVGITPTEDGIEIDPLDIGLKHLSVKNLYVGDNNISVFYQKGSTYRVEVNGKTVFEKKEPEKAVIKFWNK